MLLTLTHWHTDYWCFGLMCCPPPQECKGLGVFSQAQALDYLGSKLTQRGKGGFERRRKSKVRPMTQLQGSVLHLSKLLTCMPHLSSE